MPSSASPPQDALALPCPALPGIARPGPAGAPPRRAAQPLRDQRWDALPFPLRACGTARAQAAEPDPSSAAGAIKAHESGSRVCVAEKRTYKRVARHLHMSNLPLEPN